MVAISDETTIDDAEDLDLIMLMYNLLEYSSNRSDTTGSLWFYSIDEATNIEDDNTFKSFEYKTKVIGRTAAANGILENATITVPLKNLSNFWRSLKMK